MKKINSIIIDDEISAINTLSGMVQEYCPDVNIVAAVSNENEALLAINKYNPDLILLDIEMPPFTNGIEFINKFPDRNFETIITSAYPQYAIKSVNSIQPCGYLIKPFSVEQLILAIKKAKHIIQNASAKRSLAADQGIIVADQRKGNVVLRYSEILYFKSEESYVSIVYLANGKEQKIITFKRLKEIDSNLPESFFRIHHSTIVNMDKIVRYVSIGRSGLVYLSTATDTTLEVSVAKMGSFQDRFNSFISTGI